MNSPGAKSDADTASSVDALESKVLMFPAFLYIVVMIVVAALFVGIAQVTLPVFTTPEELMRPMPPPEVAVAREASLYRCRMANSTLALGTYAALIAVALGVGEASARRFGSGTVIRLVIGVVVAVAAGCVAGLLGNFVNEQLISMKADRELTRTVLAQVTLMGLLGLGIGACVGLVAQGASAAVRVGLIGLFAGALAGIAFPIICSIAIPTAPAEDTVPGGYLRGEKKPVVLALWLLVPGMFLAWMLPMVDRLKPRRRKQEQKQENAVDPDVSNAEQAPQ